MLKSLKQRGFIFKRAGTGVLSRNSFPQKDSISYREKLKCIMEGAAITVMIGMFFYRTIWSIPFLLPVYLLYYRERRKFMINRSRKETSMQFKEAILSVSASQKTGYSVENAFRQAYEDMLLLYGKDSTICRELYTILVGLSNNLILEKLLYDFGRRSGVEDIAGFAEVFAAAKRNGGNMTEVIDRCASVIEDKVETEKEIQLLISAKQLEQRIMNIVPFGILLYIGVTSKGFFDVLYHNLPGVLIMSLCLIVYIGAVLLSVRIVNIEV